MAKNEAKIKFTAETGEFNSQINKANSELGQLRAELKLNETQMKNAGTSVEGLEQKHQLLQRQLSASESKTEALTQKVNKAVAIFGENSDEVNKLRTQLANAQTEQAKLERAVKDCASALDDQKKSAKEVDETFSKMGETISGVVKGGFVAVAGAIGGAGVVAGKTANDIDSATDTFIAKTGESKESADEFEDAMIDIYNGNYGESFEDISESMATIKTTLGDIGTEELESLTTKAIVLRDTFDMDVNESIRGVNSMMDQFGITADEAYNLIAQGAQNGLNQNGDLLDVVNEYSVQFASAGFSAEDMFNMLKNGADQGTWSVDKLGDAVKEYNIRISDGTVADALEENREKLGLTEQEVKNLSSAYGKGGEEGKAAMKKTLDAVLSVEDETERYKLGVSMFGTMWEDLGEDAVKALLDTNGEISTTKNTLKEIDSVKYDNLGSAIEGIKRNLQTSLAGPMKEEVMPVINEFIEGTDWQGVGNTIASAFSGIAKGAVAIAKGVKSAVSWMNQHKGVMIAVASVVGVLAGAITAYNVVQGIKTAMDAANVTTVWGLVAAHWAQATAAMAAIAPYVLIVAAIAAVIAIIVLCIKNWDKIVVAVKNCISKMTAAWKSFTNWLNAKVVKPVLNWFKNLWSGITKVFANVGSWFKNKFTSAKNGVLNAWKSVKSWFSNLWIGIKSVFSNVGSWFKSKFTSAKNGVVNAFSNVKSKFVSIKNGVVNAFSNVKQKLVQPFERARDAIKKVADKIKGFFSKMKISLPKIKLPTFKIKGKFSLNPPSVPKLSITWNKDGAIFTRPTIFNTPMGLQGVGEASAEAVLPIDKLQGYVENAIEKTQQVVNMNALANAIEDLANRPIQMNINGRQFALATASDGDSVNGLRSTFKSRGLVLE